MTTKNKFFEWMRLELVLDGNRLLFELMLCKKHADGKSLIKVSQCCVRTHKWSMKNLIVLGASEAGALLCFCYLNEKWNHLFFGSAFISVPPIFAGSLGIIMNDNINETHRKKNNICWSVISTNDACATRNEPGKVRKFPRFSFLLPRLRQRQRGEINVLNNKILRTFLKQGVIFPSLLRRFSLFRFLLPHFCASWSFSFSLLFLESSTKFWMQNQSRKKFNSR